MKRAVRPQVKMKLKQHWQQPPDLAMFGCSRSSFRENIYDEEDECRDRDRERDRNVVGNCYEVMEIIIGVELGLALIKKNHCTGFVFFVS